MPTSPSPDALIAAIRAAVADVPSALRAAEALASHNPPSELTDAVAAELDYYLESLAEHYGSTAAAAAIGTPLRTFQWRLARARARRAA